MRKLKGKLTNAGTILALTAIITGLSLPTIASSLTKTINVTTGVQVYIDDIKIDTKDANGNPVEPFIHNGTTYLPVRAVADALKVDVAWEQSTNSVHLGKHTKKIEETQPINNPVTKKPTPPINTITAKKHDIKEEPTDPNATVDWVGVYKEQYTHNANKRFKSSEIYDADYIPTITLKEDGTVEYLINWLYMVCTHKGKWAVDETNLNKVHITNLEGVDNKIALTKDGENIILNVVDRVGANGGLSTSSKGDIYKKIK